MELTVRIERVIDLPRVIVWDALVDPVLVEGWLHPALRLVDGEPAVELRERVDPAPGVDGILRVRSDELGELRFALVERDGGTRDSSSLITLDAQLADPRFGGALRQSWEGRLDQLENLLRGHPTVWRDELAAADRRFRASNEGAN
ncbi:MAG: hypothetical protein ABJA11_01865 [Pseudolysinimonas sp.]